MKKIAIVVFSLWIGTAFAHPNMNVNVEDSNIYDASSADTGESYTIKPLPVRRLYLSKEKLNLYENKLPVNEESGWYFKPINSIDLKFFGTNEETVRLEGTSGLELKKGGNFFSFADGFISFGDHFFGYYQAKNVFNKDDQKVSFFRGYIKLNVGKFSIEGGKDNINWGPGEYGLLLSDNVPPYYLVKIQNEIPLRFLGEWDIAIMNGWLHEDRRDVSNPQIMGLRIAYRPFSILELGGTRTTMYGGKGRPSYNFPEHFKVFWGTDENIPGSKYDNDGYAAYDISLKLPFIPYFKQFKIYFQKAGSDIKAPWQKEDSGKFYSEFPFFVKLLATAYQAGIDASTDKDVFRFEYQKTNGEFYSHHIYNYEGYSYKGFSLGYPYGRNVLSFFFKHTHFFNDNLAAQYKVGYYKQMTGNYSEYSDGMKRVFIQLQADKKIRKFTVSPYVRYDRTIKYDRNPEPNQRDITDNDKNFFILGLSTNYAF